MPELAAVYPKVREARHAGFISMPPSGFQQPGWRTIPTRMGRDRQVPLDTKRCLHAWQTPAHPLRRALARVDSADLRAEGIYRIMTPKRALDELKGRAKGPPRAASVLRGMPIDLAWKYLSIRLKSLGQLRQRRRQRSLAGRVMSRFKKKVAIGTAPRRASARRRPSELASEGATVACVDVNAKGVVRPSRRSSPPKATPRRTPATCSTSLDHQRSRPS